MITFEQLAVTRIDETEAHVSVSGYKSIVGHKSITSHKDVKTMSHKQLRLLVFKLIASLFVQPMKATC